MCTKCISTVCLSSRVQTEVLVVLPVVLVLHYCMYKQQAEQRVKDDSHNFY